MYVQNLVVTGQAVWVYTGRSPKLWGCQDPATSDGVADPEKHVPPLNEIVPNYLRAA